MKLYNYISLNIFSIFGLSYIALIPTIYLPNASLYVDKILNYYFYALFLSVFCLTLFLFKILMKKFFNKNLLKIKFKNRIMKNIHDILFIIGS